MKNAIEKFIISKSKWTFMLLFAFLLGNEKVYANHKLGGYIEYSWNNNHNWYDVTVVSYDDLGGSLPSTLTLWFDFTAFSNGAGSTTMTLDPNPVTTDFSVCGSVLHVRKGIYRGSISAPSNLHNPNKFNIACTLEDRDDSYNTAWHEEINGSGVFANIILKAHNEGLGSNSDHNSSPQINNDPIWISYITGSNSEYNPGLTDADAGDIISGTASLTPPIFFPDALTANNTTNPTNSSGTITYTGGHDFQNPVSLLGSTGFYGNDIFTYNPTAVGEIGPVDIKYIDKNSNGDVKGFITIDFEIRTYEPFTGPYLSEFNWNQGFEINAYEDCQLCFSIWATDSDPNNLITLATNILQSGILPAGATVNIYNSSPVAVPQLEICWTPVIGDAGDYNFNVTATNNHTSCIGSVSNHYTIHVLPNPITVSIPTPAPYCSGSPPNGGITLTPSIGGTTGTVTYAWSPATGLNCSTCQNPVASPSVTTTYTLTIDDASLICPQSATVVVTVYPTTNVSLFGPSVMCEPVTQIFTASTGAPATGTYYWTCVGGTPTSGTVAVSGTSTSTFTVNSWTSSTSGTVSVYFVNSFGCQSPVATVTVNECCLGNPITLTNTSVSVALANGALPSQTLNTTNTIAINGILIIDMPLTFIGCTDVVLNSGAVILVSPGKTLTINSSVLYACKNMWQGIEVYAGATLNVTDSKILDAIIAARSKTSPSGQFGLLNIDLSTFNKNLTGIQFDPLNGLNTSSITSSLFESYPDATYSPGVNLKAPYNYTQGQIGIFIDHVTGNAGSFNGAITIGSDASASLMNTFDNLYTGIKSFSSNFNCYNNKFKNMLNASLLSQFCNTCCTKGTGICMIGNTAVSSFSIIGASGSNQPNYFENCAFGITSRTNYNLSIGSNFFSDVKKGITCLENFNNLIVTSDNNFTSPSGIIRSTAIYIGNATTQNTAVFAQRNNIESYRFGIRIVNTNATGFLGVNISDNRIKFTGLLGTGPHYGIWCQKSAGTQIYNNTVFSDDPNYFATTNGICIESNQKNLVYCNVTDRMFNGIYVKDDCAKTLIYCNNLRHFTQGINFKNANLQIAQYSNAWGTNNRWTLGGVHALNGNIVSPIDWFWSNYYGSVYNPTFGMTMYPNSFTNGNIPILTSNNTQICKPHSGCVGIDDNWGISESGDERHHLLGDIVNDSTEFNSFTDEMRYINRQFALSELLNDSTLLNTGSPDDYLYLQFVDSMMYTPIGYSEMVQNKIRSKQFDSAAYFNNLIVSERNMDENRRVVNEIYLNHFAEPDSVLTAEDTAVLYDIAMQEPLLAGDAVYSARVMLGMEPDEEGFDFRTEETPAFTRVKMCDCFIYPNPASDNFNIDYDLGDYENLTFEVMDILGRNLIRKELDKEQYREQINTSNFPSGIYLVKIKAGSETIFQSKIEIAK